MEGWLISFVYGQFMTIFMDIEGTLLRMTERKISENSKKFDFVSWPERNDYRHDALLLMEAVKLDVVVVEAKPTEVKSDDDFKKLGIVLSNDILSMKDRYPAIPEQDLKAHGIMFVGYQVYLLETRLKDGSPVVFTVSSFKIPKGGEESDHQTLLLALKWFISFGKRVRNNVELILKTLPVSQSVKK
jgi:hypothetical protein